MVPLSSPLGLFVWPGHRNADRQYGQVLAPAEVLIPYQPAQVLAVSGMECGRVQRFDNGPDESEGRNEPIEAFLRVMDRMLMITRHLQHKRGDYWLTSKLRFFRGPWLLQLALTPLFAFNGILFSERNISWMVTGTNRRRLRITPLVPAEFWVDVQFRTSEDADAVADLIGQWWLHPTPRHEGLVQLLQRWPEAFAAPLFMVPMAIGFTAGDLFWTGVGCASFVAFVVVGMALAGRQHAKEQRLPHDNWPTDSTGPMH